MEGVIPHSWNRQDSTSNGSSASLSENDKNPMKRSKTDALPAHAGLEHRSQKDSVNGRPMLSDLTNVPVRVSDQNNKVKASSQHAGTWGASIPSSIFNDPGGIDSSSQSGHGVLSERKRHRDWIDVDALNHEDPQACSHYAQDIMMHLREAETRRRPNPLYLSNFQPEVNAKMRGILVDWLVEVGEEYRLCADTLYLTVNYIDRFLSLHKVARAQLQLVGVTCMWIAAKYEEIYPPNVADFSYITDNTYQKEQMVEMEEIVLKTLQYELTVPTAKAFLRRLLQVCSPDEQLHFLSNYLAELTLLDHNMMAFLPSKVAAASVFLAQVLLNREPWDGTLQHYSTYCPLDFEECTQALTVLHIGVEQNPQLQALRDKYGQARFLGVSTIPPLGPGQLAGSAFV